MSSPMPVEGEQATDFQLPDAGEKEVALADVRGRWVVLYFYPKDNTSGCTTEAQEFANLLPEFSTADAGGE